MVMEYNGAGAAIRSYVHGPGSLDNCCHFAIDAWRAGTGENLDPWGINTPDSLHDKVIDQNGGRTTNGTAEWHKTRDRDPSAAEAEKKRRQESFTCKYAGVCN
jgi:hypothetical protein